MDIHTGQGTTNSITNTFTARVIPRLARGKWQISALNTSVCLLSTVGGIATVHFSLFTLSVRLSIFPPSFGGNI